MNLTRWERLRKLAWTWHQPLAELPQVGAVVSDLFVWRNSADWNTCFELIDLPALFSDERRGPACVRLVLFDHGGNHIKEVELELITDQRRQINLSELLEAKDGEIGTFAVFHSWTPVEVINLGAFLAERGYLSYQYLGAPLRAYVHGNLDAIAQAPGSELARLCGSSFMPRTFNLQHELRGPARYEIGLVNPSSRPMQVRCSAVATVDGKVKETSGVTIAAGGAHLFGFQIAEQTPVRIVLESKLVMARPLVFRIENFKLDVFHG